MCRGNEGFVPPNGCSDSLLLCEKEAVFDRAEVGVKGAIAELGHLQQHLLECRPDVAIDGHDGRGECEVESVEHVVALVWLDIISILAAEEGLVRIPLLILVFFHERKNGPIFSASWVQF